MDIFIGIQTCESTVWSEILFDTQCYANFSAAKGRNMFLILLITIISTILCVFYWD